MNKNQEFFKILDEIEIYIALALLIIIFVLEVFNLASEHTLSAITLIIFGYIIIGNIRIKKVAEEIPDFVSKLDDTQNSMSRLEKLTNPNKIFHTDEEIMIEVARMLLDPKNKNQDIEVYIYKAYDITIGKDENYFKNTIEAIEKDYINNYHRIITLNNSEEVRNLIKTIKLFSKSEQARTAKLFVNYRPIANYISFIAISNGNCFVGLPKLSDDPWEIKGHQCGILINDSKVFQGLKEVFQTIRGRDDCIELIPIPDSSFTDDDWEKLEKDIERKRLNGVAS